MGAPQANTSADPTALHTLKTEPNSFPQVYKNEQFIYSHLLTRSTDFYGKAVFADTLKEIGAKMTLILICDKKKTTTLGLE